MFLSVHRAVSNVSFHGRILFKEPIINPVNAAIVVILKFLNSHERKFENERIQIITHTKNIKIGTISKFFTASIIGSYIHSNTRMKLPEIPGKIIAQIAIAPQMNIRRHVDAVDRGAFVGEVIKNAKAQKIIKQEIVFQSRFTCFHKKTAETSTRPTKNDHINIG